MCSTQLFEKFSLPSNAPRHSAGGKMLLWNAEATPGEKITPNDFLLQILYTSNLSHCLYFEFSLNSIICQSSKGIPSTWERERAQICTFQALWKAWERLHEKSFCDYVSSKRFGSCRSQCSSSKLCSPLARPLLVNKVFVLGKVSASSRVFLVIIQAQDNERNSKMDNWLIRERELDEVWSKWLINKCFGVDLNYSE